MLLINLSTVNAAEAQNAKKKGEINVIKLLKSSILLIRDASD